MSEEQRARRLGAMLKCAALEDPYEYRFMFDLSANTFLQKLVPKRLMDRKLAFGTGEMFRSLLTMSYFVNVLDSGDGLLDNVAVLYEARTKADRKATLPLGLIAAELAVFAAEQRTADRVPEAQARFAALETKQCACDPAALDPYYEGIGFLLLDQLRSKEIADRVASKAGYVAAVFADTLVPHLKAGADRVEGCLRRGEWWEASVEALRASAQGASIEDLERYFQES